MTNVKISSKGQAFLNKSYSAMELAKQMVNQESIHISFLCSGTPTDRRTISTKAENSKKFTTK